MEGPSEAFEFLMCRWAWTPLWILTGIAVVHHMCDGSGVRYVTATRLPGLFELLQETVAGPVTLQRGVAENTRVVSRGAFWGGTGRSQGGVDLRVDTRGRSRGGWTGGSLGGREGSDMELPQDTVQGHVALLWLAPGSALP